jgi:hypothetical protein
MRTSQKKQERAWGSENYMKNKRRLETKMEEVRREEAGGG